MIAFLRDTLITIVIALAIFFGLQTTIQNYVVDGPSMSPNFINGERILVNKLVYKHFEQPRRGDVIIFHAPNQPPTAIPLIKRIIGLPGESVEISNGKVYIHKKDGTVSPLNEPYITDPARYPFVGDKIPVNQYFVLGDNRNNSGDSREGWTVPYSNIIGKAWISTWPPSIWGLAKNYSFAKEGGK